MKQTHNSQKLTFNIYYKTLYKEYTLYNAKAY